MGFFEAVQDFAGKHPVSVDHPRRLKRHSFFSTRVTLSYKDTRPGKLTYKKLWKDPPCLNMFNGKIHERNGHFP